MVDALPSADVAVEQSGVFWPASSEPSYDFLGRSDHHPVWVQIRLGDRTESFRGSAHDRDRAVVVAVVAVRMVEVAVDEVVGVVAVRHRRMSAARPVLVVGGVAGAVVGGSAVGRILGVDREGVLLDRAAGGVVEVPVVQVVDVAVVRDGDVAAVGAVAVRMMIVGVAHGASGGSLAWASALSMRCATCSSCRA